MVDEKPKEIFFIKIDEFVAQNLFLINGLQWADTNLTIQDMQADFQINKELNKVAIPLHSHVW